MNCPTDRALLEAHTVGSLSVEECPECRGVWFDQDELRRAKDAAKPDLNWMDFDVWSNPTAMKAAWSSRECPICEKNMATIEYGSTGEKVDYCLEEHGMWLDKGEFEAIIEHLNSQANSMDVSEYVSASLEEAKEIVSGGEGFISEWKDFATVTRLLQYRILVENPTLAELLHALQSTSPFR